MKQKRILEEKKQAYSNYVRVNLLISNLGMRTLRMLFRSRYTAFTGMEWENGSLTLGQELISSGKATLELTSEQQAAFTTADINKWDFYLLVILLMNLRPRRLSNEDAIADSRALKVLVSIRKYLENISGDRISNQEFEVKWEEVKEALLRFGAREKDIEHFRTSSKLQNLGLSTATTATLHPGNERKSKAMRNRATELIASGKFERGVKLYSDALLLNGLSTGRKSDLHSCRSQAYITELEDHLDILWADVIQNYVEVAMEDAQVVVQLQPEYWKGYFLEGKCFQLQNLLSEAIDSFEIALSLNPESEEALNARSECRYDRWDKGSAIKSDPLNMTAEVKIPRNLLTIIESNEAMLTHSDPGVRARACVFLAHRYIKGDGYSMNKRKGTELFLLAAEIGSPDGAYNAGVSYLKGIGVKRSVPEAVKLMEVAAKHPLKSGFEHQFNNKAASKAKECLGEFYQNGVGKTRDYAEAAKWFALAAVEGMGSAAHKLATMYHHGIGVARDSKRAVQYQKLAVELGQEIDSSMAIGEMHYLGAMYAEVGDLTQARYWSTGAVHSGFLVDPHDQQYLDSLLHYKQQMFDHLKKKLPNNVLKSSKVPIYDLYERLPKRLHSGSEEIIHLHRTLFTIQSNPDKVRADSGDGVERALDIAEVEREAAAGQEYAQILLTAQGRAEAGVKALQSLLDDEGSKGEPAVPVEELKKSALAHFTFCYMEHMGPVVTKSMSKECRAKLMEVANEFVSDGEKSASDFHARVCLSTGSEFAKYGGVVKFFEQCKSRYPEQAIFHGYLGKFQGFVVSHKVGAKVIEEGLVHCPDNSELLHTRAALLRFCWEPKLANGEWDVEVEDFFRNEPPPSEDETMGEVMMRWLRAACGTLYDGPIEAYQKFVRQAPSGHKKIPDSYYWMAVLSAAAGNLKDVEVNYKLGVEAENKLLSNFQGYASVSKKLAEQCLKIIEGAKDPFKYPLLSRNFFQILLEEDAAEAEESRKLKLDDPKRTAIFKYFRRTFLTWEVDEGFRSTSELLDMMRHNQSDIYTMEGKQVQRAPSPSEIPSLKDILFENLNTTIDWIYEGRAMNLTIMEEYIDGVKDPVHTVVKDDNDDFNIISFYGFDRTDPSTRKKLGFGSRIRLMNPFFRRSQEGGPMIRVDDPDSVEFVSMGIDNPVCRYCWKPDPSSRCGKCKTAQYCSKECQRLDWDVLRHKEICKIISKQQRAKSDETI